MGQGGTSPTVPWAVSVLFLWIQHSHCIWHNLPQIPKETKKCHKPPCLTHLGDVISSLWPTADWELRVCFSNALLFKGCCWITDQLRLEGTSGVHLVQSPAQAGPLRASCSGPCPESLWLSPRPEVPHPHPTFVDLSVTESWICLLQHCHISHTTNSMDHYLFPVAYLYDCKSCVTAYIRENISVHSSLS